MRRALLAAAAVVVLLAAAVALVLDDSGGGAAADTGAAGGTAFGKAERRTLAEHVTATGTIGYAGETVVLARLTGTVTALPAVGDVVGRGARLYGLDGEPVLLMYGEVPAYRNLAEGVDEGPDVEQLERNLASLGYSPGVVDDDFTWETAEAVRDWQESHGLETTGEVELGRVVFAPGPQRVTALEARLGEALGGAGGGSEAGSEEGGAPSIPVLRASSTRRVVTVDLEADQQSIAHRGQKVKVVLPGGAEVPGEVRGLAATEPAAGEEGAGEEAEPGVEATIAVTGKHRIPALDGATVNVLFTEQVRKDVLSVPLTALIAIGGDRFAVYVGGAARRQVVVKPGLAAAGFVEVEAAGLQPGMEVEVGR